jgi:hypothetical protein
MPLAELRTCSKEQDHECSCNKTLHGFFYLCRKLKYLQSCFDMEALDENSRIRRYSDLSGSYHSAASKVLLCREYFRSQMSPDLFSLAHQIPLTSMKRMIAKYQSDQESGISTFRDSGSGRPSKIDSAGSESILTELAKRTKAQHAPNRAEFKAMVVTEIAESAKRRNIADAAPSVSRRTMEL